MTSLSASVSPITFCRATLCYRGIWCRRVGGAENAGVENAGVIKYGKPSKQGVYGQNIKLYDTKSVCENEAVSDGL